MFAQKLIDLSEQQYLPLSGNRKLPSERWTAKINFAIWISAQGAFSQEFALFLNYSDSQGEHCQLIDNYRVYDENDQLFSDLVKIPIQGEIQNVFITYQCEKQPSRLSVVELFCQVVNEAELFDSAEPSNSNKRFLC